MKYKAIGEFSIFFSLRIKTNALRDQTENGLIR